MPVFCEACRPLADLAKNLKPEWIQLVQMKKCSGRENLLCCKPPLFLLSYEMRALQASDKESGQANVHVRQQPRISRRSLLTGK